MYTCVASSATGESSWSGMLTVKGSHTETFHTVSICCTQSVTLTLHICVHETTHSARGVLHQSTVHSQCRSDSMYCLHVMVSLPAFCNRGWSFFSVQSFWVHPASRTAPETHSDRSDQKHRHPHLAVQPSWRRGCCHLVHYWSFQVRSGTHFKCWSWRHMSTTIVKYNNNSKNNCINVIITWNKRLEWGNHKTEYIIWWE